MTQEQASKSNDVREPKKGDKVVFSEWYAMLYPSTAQSFQEPGQVLAVASKELPVKAIPEEARARYLERYGNRQTYPVTLLKVRWSHGAYYVSQFGVIVV